MCSVPITSVISSLVDNTFRLTLRILGGQGRLRSGLASVKAQTHQTQVKERVVTEADCCFACLLVKKLHYTRKDYRQIARTCNNSLYRKWGGGLCWSIKNGTLEDLGLRKDANEDFCSKFLCISRTELASPDSEQ